MHTPSNQGIHTHLATVGILQVHPSNTPQNPSSQACATCSVTQRSPERNVENALTRAYAKRVGGGINTLNPDPTKSEWVSIAAA